MGRGRYKHAFDTSDQREKTVLSFSDCSRPCTLYSCSALASKPKEDKHMPCLTLVKDKGGTSLSPLPRSPFCPSLDSSEDWLSRSHLRRSGACHGPVGGAEGLKALARARCPPSPAAHELAGDGGETSPPALRLRSPFESGPGFIKNANDPCPPPVHREPGSGLQLGEADPASLHQRLLKCECPPCVLNRTQRQSSSLSHSPLASFRPSSPWAPSPGGKEADRLFQVRTLAQAAQALGTGQEPV